MSDRKPRDPALLERRIRSLINTAADWRARALNAEREVERLKALLTSTEPTPAVAVNYNPDPQAWADMFVETFPEMTGKRTLMLGWFANAMMATRHSLGACEPTAKPQQEHTEAAHHLDLDAVREGTDNG